MRKHNLHLAGSGRRPPPSDRKDAIDTFTSTGKLVIRDEGMVPEIVNHCIAHRWAFTWHWQSLDGETLVCVVRTGGGQVG